MNWGTKLTIGMVLFMGFIVTLVILMIKPHQADSLIESDYYEKGQKFDRDYNAVHNASRDSIIPLVEIEEKEISIRFPKAVSYKILLRNLADASLDKTIDGKLAEKDIVISENITGSWLLRVDYSANGNDYLYQNKIRIP